MRKTFRKTNVSDPLIRTRACAYQGVTNVSFSENFAYVLNGWFLMPKVVTKVIRSDFCLSFSVITQYLAWAGHILIKGDWILMLVNT